MSLMNDQQFGAVNDQYSQNGGSMPALQFPEQNGGQAGYPSPYGMYGRDAAIGRGTSKAIDYAKNKWGSGSAVSEEAGQASFSKAMSGVTNYEGLPVTSAATEEGGLLAGGALGGAGMAVSGGVGLAAGGVAKLAGADNEASTGIGAGAALGTAIMPGVGTAVGAVAGGVLGEIFHDSHKKAKDPWSDWS